MLQANALMRAANKVLLVVIDTLAAWFLIWCCKTACPHAVRASLSDGFLSALSNL